MIKYLFILLSISLLFSMKGFSQTTNEFNEFEEELRRLEAQDQALMNRVEDLSKQDPSNEHVIDSVSVENAATSRPEEGLVDPKPAPITQESPSLKKSRRIRSR